MACQDVLLNGVRSALGTFGQRLALLMLRFDASLLQPQNAGGEPRQQPQRGTSEGCWRRLQCLVRRLMLPIYRSPRLLIPPLDEAIREVRPVSGRLAPLGDLEDVAGGR
jgi:hypothetical protein